MTYPKEDDPDQDSIPFPSIPTMLGMRLGASRDEEDKSPW
jgi:hypothetical protein